MIAPSRNTLPLLALLLGLALAGEGWAARQALLIGITDYAQSAIPDLPGAQSDLVLVEEVLESRLGLAPGEIRVLRNQEATHGGILVHAREPLDNELCIADLLEQQTASSATASNSTRDRKLD